MDKKSVPNPLAGVNKPRVLAEAFKSGGENGVRFMAQLINATACDGCDFIKSHCRCGSTKNKQ